MIWFGTAGIADSFAAQGYKKSIDVPMYLNKMGLNAFEYQCGRGVKVSETSAIEFGKKAKEHGIKLSLHAPYYISLSSTEEEKRENSISYILQSAKAAKAMGATRIIVHSGSCSKISREYATDLARETLKKALIALDENGLSDIHICPETMGKFNQLGSLDEVLELCKIDERMIPCIDFGHLNCRTLGKYKDVADFKEIFDSIENQLGIARLKEFHAHFSKIEYTEKGGEKKHLTFADTIYGPEFDPVAELIVKKNCTPTIICESDGTQSEDAQTMQIIYKNKGGDFSA